MKSDYQLKQDVLEELMWDPSIKETDIGVEVKEGVVTLAGHLDSYAEKYAAERAVQNVAGVKGVVVEIDVKIPGLHKRTDADIVLSVRNALEWNTWVPKDTVKVKVENGWVTLSGVVEYGYQRSSAENAVRPLLGVKGISNQITVKPSVSDKNVKIEIEAALQRRAHIETQSISVTVNGDQVTLTGSIPSWPERNAVIKAASCAPGVAKVIDNMRIV